MGELIGGVIGLLIGCALIVAVVIITIWCFVKRLTKDTNPHSITGVENGGSKSSRSGAGSSNALTQDTTFTSDPSYIKNPTQTSLDGDGYSDPHYYGENSNRIAAGSVNDTTEEDDGYTNLMQMQKMLVDTGRDGSATQPNDTPNPGYINPPTRVNLENELYSDPRYYGREGRRSEATRGKVAGEGSHTTSTKSDENSSLENVLYSDPWYAEEGRRSEATRSKVADHTTPTKSDEEYQNPSLENDLYSDPRYYVEEGRRSEATRSKVGGEVGHTTPTKSDEIYHNPSLENVLYSDPRYYGEEGRRPEATRGTITGGANGYTNPNGPDPSTPKAVPKCNTTTPDEARTSTSTQSALEMDGYSDPRYLR